MMALKSAYLCFGNKQVFKIICSQYAKYSNVSALSVKQTFSENVLETTSEDLSHITPYFSNTFNLAAYVNNSETLKKLVDINVDLSKIEKKPHIVNKILKLDFEKHMKEHIIFLNDYVGLDEVGNFLTKNPLILCEPVQDLQVRVNYLESKGFQNDQIKRIITRNPFWLMFNTVRIDRRFGYFQKSLQLTGNEVRHLTTKQPKLITYNLHHVKCNMFVLKEEMGFEDKEMKDLTLNKPKLLMINQRHLLERFNYIHNIMQISHKTILKYPEVLFCRNFKIKQRHQFLLKLGRAQYDPKKENFISIKSLVLDTDAEFCNNIAKCSVSDFNLFLKTL
ncbi:transcription termination factor 3, mitochondrial [Trichoplusia ni]|uniref:Transcription termination factor 3, mitochondrial n=1 Tax=Trichoplusia ni TaxID=7111 RepID=A0A7E5WD19_TRINI|nr:transcription termination factor 3, mitochondrial [Trichoplusia ni]